MAFHLCLPSFDLPAQGALVGRVLKMVYYLRNVLTCLRQDCSGSSLIDYSFLITIIIVSRRGCVCRPVGRQHVDQPVADLTALAMPVPSRMDNPRLPRERPTNYVPIIEAPR